MVRYAWCVALVVRGALVPRWSDARPPLSVSGDLVNPDDCVKLAVRLHGNVGAMGKETITVFLGLNPELVPDRDGSSLERNFGVLGTARFADDYFLAVDCCDDAVVLAADGDDVVHVV